MATFVLDKPGCVSQSEGSTGDSFSCTQRSGFVMSPGYFDPYPTDINITWNIATKPWTRISLDFIELDVKSLEVGCNEDYVIITDISSQTTLGRFCDRNQPSGIIWSSLNRMEIMFHSDSIGSGSGFLAAYSTSHLVPDVINIKESMVLLVY